MSTPREQARARPAVARRAARRASSLPALPRDRDTVTLELEGATNAVSPSTSQASLREPATLRAGEVEAPPVLADGPSTPGLRPYARGDRIETPGRQGGAAYLQVVGSTCRQVCVTCGTSSQ